MGALSASVGGALVLGIVGFAFMGTSDEPGATRSEIPIIDQPEQPQIGETPRGEPADQSERKARFIVRFSGIDAVDEIIKTYRNSKSGAADQFDKWAAGQPELAGFSLERATYSDELILVYSESAGGRSMKDAQKDLLEMQQVRYADLDGIVTIEEGKPK